MCFVLVSISEPKASDILNLLPPLGFQLLLPIRDMLFSLITDLEINR